MCPYSFWRHYFGLQSDTMAFAVAFVFNKGQFIIGSKIGDIMRIAYVCRIVLVGVGFLVYILVLITFV